jgi:hypothetical protein
MPFKGQTTQEEQFGIVCVNEQSLVISNSRTGNFWNTLDELVSILLTNSNFSTETLLFSWKKEPHHLATPKELYAWRSTLDEIKNSDLGLICERLKEYDEKHVLITDKPTMLKIAGEVTNSLLHSYTSRHRISFVQLQNESKVPS